MTASDLLTTLQKAEAGSRELDEAVHDVLCDSKFRTCIAGLSDEQGGLWMYEFKGHAPGSALRCTQSLDAALALVERVLPEANCYGFDKCPKGVTGYVSRNNVKSGHWLIEANAPTPPLALVIALVRAKEASDDHD